MQKFMDLLWNKLEFSLSNILYFVTLDMAEHLYNWEEVLDFVLADSGEQKSDSDDELIADVEDESVEACFWA